MKSKYLAFIGAVILSCLPKSASAYQVALDSFTGDSASALLEITGAGTNAVTFEIIRVTPLADIRGFFFDVGNSAILSDLTVAGNDVNSYRISENGVANLGGGVNMNPADAFDVGLEIGTPGTGKDDIQTTRFTVYASQAIVLGEMFGLRLTSLGDDENREGGSKLSGTYAPPEPVPAPSAIYLLGAGLVSLVGLRKRKKHSPGLG